MSDNVQRNNEFLLAAVTDTESTIRATDTKASIALVVHGLLFSGLVGVTKDMGKTYDAASGDLRVAVWILLGIVVISFLLSVGCLLICIAPSPRSAIPDISPLGTGNFFIPMRAQGFFSPRVSTADVSAYSEAVAAMDESARQDQLMGEVLKLSAIRERKTTLARRGLFLLAGELAAGLAYLVLLGLHAT